MTKISIIIPSRNEKYLKKTVDDIQKKATGDYEIIIGWNGKTEYEIPDIPFPSDKIRFVYEKEAIGLKPMINKLVKEATGKYILKSDAHCMFGEGFDEILQSIFEFVPAHILDDVALEEVQVIHCDEVDRLQRKLPIVWRGVLFDNTLWFCKTIITLFANKISTSVFNTKPRKITPTYFTKIIRH